MFCFVSENVHFSKFKYFTYNIQDMLRTSSSKQNLQWCSDAASVHVQLRTRNLQNFNSKVQTHRPCLKVLFLLNLCKYCKWGRSTATDVKAGQANSVYEAASLGHEQKVHIHKLWVLIHLYIPVFRKTSNRSLVSAFINRGVPELLNYTQFIYK